MRQTETSLRIFRTVWRTLRITMRVIGVTLVMIILTFVYLRSYGIPDPLLRAVIRRANEAGIPVDISAIRPSVTGWRADNVRYFSMNPADTNPIFKAKEIYFARQPFFRSEDSREWTFDIEALDVEIGASVEWGVEVPEQSRTRNIETIKLSLSFLPDRIELSDGAIHWLGSSCSVDGTIVKQTAATRLPQTDEPKKVKQETVSPVYVSKEMFQSLEDRFDSISIKGDVIIDIDFHVDANDYSASTLDIKAEADEIMVLGAGFSRSAITANYRYPLVRVEHVGLHRGEDVAQLAGTYNVSNRMLQGSLSNTMTSKQLLEAFPRPVHDLLAALDMHVGQFPQFEISLSPCNPPDALNHISGTFSVEDFTYAGSTIKSLGGKLERRDNRLLLSELEGTMLGLESRAEEMGSAMLGGAASGSVYFDSKSYWFGVDADVNFDPSLLIGPLSPVPIATNVMHRLKFNDKNPPRCHLEMGSCVTNWSTFFINIQMTGNDVTLHDAELSSVDVSASYSNKVLVLEPLTTMQGTNDLTGMVSIDFGESSAQFDIVTSIPPLTLQNAAYPQLGVFGKSIKTSGTTSIKAKGLLDWKQMKATDFNADVWAEKIELPGAHLTGFSGTVSGVGPLIAVKETRFTLYEGTGAGDVSLEIAPEKQGLPLGIDLKFEKVNLRQFLKSFEPDAEVNAYGELDATVRLHADLKEKFLASANGDISVAIKDGQLADLPYLKTFSKFLRRLLPSFHVFSFTEFSGDFQLAEGVIKSEDAYLGGALISVNVHGSYSDKDELDAQVQVQTSSSRRGSKIVRAVADPLLGLFKIRLTGPLKNPSFELE